MQLMICNVTKEKYIPSVFLFICFCFYSNSLDIGGKWDQAGVVGMRVLACKDEPIARRGGVMFGVPCD